MSYDRSFLLKTEAYGEILGLAHYLQQAMSSVVRVTSPQQVDLVLVIQRRVYRLKTEQLDEL